MLHTQMESGLPIRGVGHNLADHYALFKEKKMIDTQKAQRFNTAEAVGRGECNLCLCISL